MGLIGNTSLFMLTMGTSVLVGWLIMRATTPSDEIFLKRMTPAMIEEEEQHRRELIQTMKIMHNSGVPIWFMQREFKKIKQQQAREKMEAKRKKAKEAKLSQTL